MRSLLILFLVPTCISFAQQGPNYGPPKVIPPSPTASALGRYGEIPVSLFTGMPSIGIPLYELPSKELSLPISLSYHASGVKVDDVASWVGINWSLDAGGVITRSVRAGKDESPQSGRMDVDLPTPVELTDAFTARSYAWNSKDGEPDAYFYNFAGRSGQLMFDESGQFHTTKADKIKFEKVLSPIQQTEWILVDERGIRYFFGGNGSAVEYTSVNDDSGVQELPTAWYLTKIISADGSDEVNFTYLPKGEVNGFPSGQTYVWHNSHVLIESFIEPLPSSETSFQGEYTTAAPTTGNGILSEISSKKGRVVFETTATRTDVAGARELSAIKVYDGSDKLCRIFTLTYNVVNNRLFLASVAESEPNGISKPPYIFNYFDESGLPVRFSKAQDFWGYFNNKVNNTHLIPNVPVDYTLPANFTFADRSCDPSVIVKGSLKSIVYPTGGMTEFEYGPNTFTNGAPSLDVPTTLTINTINDATSTSETFTPRSQNARIRIHFNSFREENNNPRPVVYLQKFENDMWSSNGQHVWQIEYPSLDNQVVDFNIPVEIYKPYRLLITTEGCPNPPCNPPLPSPDHYTTDATIEYFPADDQEYISIGGGIRIKAIRDYDPNSAIPTNVRKFTYYDGVLVSVPLYYYKNYRWLCKSANPLNQSQCINMERIVKYSVTSQSLVNLGSCQGGLVVYPRVRESFGENEENGYSESYFKVSSTLGYSGIGTDPPFLPVENTDYYDGKLWQQTKHNNASTMLQKSWSLDGTGSHSVNFSTSRALKVVQTEFPSQYSNPLENMAFVFGYYDINSVWMYPDSTAELTYVEGSAPVAIGTKYYHDNPLHGQVTKTVTKTSDGKVIEVRSAYAHDSPSDTEMTTSTLTELQNRNMIATPLKSEKFVNGARKEGSISNFQLFNGVPELSSVLVLDGSEYKKRITYDKYTDGNVSTLFKANDNKISYLWGYNNVLPIAEIINAGLNEDVEYEGTSQSMPTTNVPGLQLEYYTVQGGININFDQNVTLNCTVSRGGADPSIPDHYFNVILSFMNEDTQAIINGATFGLTAQTSQVINLTPGRYALRYTYSGDIGVENTFYFNSSLDYQAKKVYSNVFYTSFEEDTQNTSAEARTGRASHVGTYLVNHPKQLGDYILTYWTKTGSANWQYHESDISVTSSTSQSVSIGSSGDLLDEVRLHPRNATMTTYAYDPLIGMTSMTDANNITTYYEYDELGRLELIRDDNGNVIKKYKYHYALDTSSGQE